MRSGIESSNLTAAASKCYCCGYDCCGCSRCNSCHCKCAHALGWGASTAAATILCRAISPASILKSRLQLATTKIVAAAALAATAAAAAAAAALPCAAPPAPPPPPCPRR
eukprot:366045-Chlamydomonas_euryale.AAC.13